jgi:hypothetical protein
MGEYAYYKGDRVKIGTCEDMLYLRWDQRQLVTNSETPLHDAEVLKAVRFRFPWPDEDQVEPGGFEAPFRGHALYGFEQPKGIDHGSVQFHADNGYQVSLPCPEGTISMPYTVHRNGYGGPAALIQQAWRGGRLVSVARCNGCHTAYRLEDGYEEAAAVAIRSEADGKYGQGRGEGAGGWLHQVADRLMAGYMMTGCS